MVHRYFAARLSNIGLTRPKFAILYQIRAGLSPVAPTFISRRMPRAKHTISQAITELENDGYIKRSINQSNRRSITLSLTKRGEEKTDEALSYARNLSREMMSCFNNTQLQDLDSYLATIRLIYLTKIKDVS
jgi:DNA-binding MarR family transcriptional regulator